MPSLQSIPIFSQPHVMDDFHHADNIIHGSEKDKEKNKRRFIKT